MDVLVSLEAVVVTKADTSSRAHSCLLVTFLFSKTSIPRTEITVFWQPSGAVYAPAIMMSE